MKKRSIMLPMIMFALVGCSEKTSAELPSLSEGNSSSEIPSATTPSISESNSENTDIPPIDESSYSNEYFMAENFSVWKTSQNYDVDEKLIIKYTSEEVDVTSSKKYNLNTYITVNSGYNITWYKGLDNYSSVIATQQDYLGYGDNIYRLAITNPSGQFIVSFAINIYVLADFTFTYFECQPGYVLASQMPIYQTQTVREGTIISGPIDNPNNGYTFKKWVTHNSETGNYEEYDFTSPITSNKTFFATYEDIMLDLGDGVNTEISFSPYLTSKLDNFIMPKEENKFFDGWYSNDTQYFDDTGIATNPLPYSEINNLKPNFVSFTQDKYFEFTKLEDKNGYSIRLKEMPTYSTELIIPNEHNDLPVVEIEDSAFYGCSSLTSITIPSSAKSIGSSAFERCTNLQTVTFESGSKLETIGSSAFSSCSSLTSITIPSSVTSIGSTAFYNCTNLQTVTFESGSKLEAIERYAFYGCGSLQYNEYGNCYYLGNNENPYLALVKAKDNDITEVTISNNTKFIIGGTFERCTNLQTVAFENGSKLESIGNLAFYGCSSLTSITIPSSAKSIGSSAFERCTNLQTVTFESGSKLETIGSSAFSSCSSLTSIVIPSSVTSIGNYAFSGCTKLKTVTFESGSKLEAIGIYVFNDCGSLQYNEYGNCYYLGNNENPYLALVKAKDKDITEVTISNNTKFIMSNAFEIYKSLTSIIIPSSVTSIGSLAFCDCTNLQTVTFESGSKLETIGSYAFSGCNSLTSIVIPSSVTSIENSAFYGCYSLTFYCEVSSQPSEWSSNWNYYRPVYWSGEWSYVNGVPTPNK